MHELLKALPRDSFERWVRTHEADKHSKGFGSWQQLVAMVYGHLAAVSSLRELEAGFNSQLTHHYHLGCSPVRRSTMADANAKRSPALLSTVVQALMTQVERRARREVGALLVAIDSTSITLKGRGFDAWTQATQTRHTQGVKLHELCAGQRSTDRPEHHRAQHQRHRRSDQAALARPHHLHLR